MCFRFPLWLVVALPCAGRVPGGSAGDSVVAQPAPNDFIAAPRRLPGGKLILSYEPQCDETRTIETAREGVNVIIWFAANLVHDAETDQAAISSGINTTCVASVARRLRELRLETAHLLCVGGWDAPHPDGRHTGAEYFVAFQQLNAKLQEEHAREGFAGFDGVDWDLEGNDAPASKYNELSLRTLDAVGEFSVLAKRHGYITSMVPPESYLDLGTQEFSRSLRFWPRDRWHPEFRYAGRNGYAYVLAKYGVRTFDLIDIQLYESWSHAGFETEFLGKRVSDFLYSWLRAWLDPQEHPYFVRFSQDATSGLQDQRLEIDAENQLVVGLSYGSADGKSFFAWPGQLGEAWNRLLREQKSLPRGVMYWNMDLEGRRGNFSTEVTTQRLYMARELNRFVGARVVAEEPSVRAAAPAGHDDVPQEVVFYL